MSRKELKIAKNFRLKKETILRLKKRSKQKPRSSMTDVLEKAVKKFCP